MIQVAFGDALKRMLLPLGFPEDVLWGPSEIRDQWVHPVLGVTARAVLQHVGTEGCRSVDPDFWVKLWADVIDKLRSGKYGYDRTKGAVELLVERSNPVLVIAPDLRFDNEHAAVEAMDDAVSVLVERPEDDGNVDAHASEVWCKAAAAQCVDHVIVNDSTLEALRTVACKLFYTVIG